MTIKRRCIAYPDFIANPVHTQWLGQMLLLQIGKKAL
jgi:hypothetical protein